MYILLDNLTIGIFTFSHRELYNSQIEKYIVNGNLSKCK